MVQKEGKYTVKRHHMTVHLIHEYQFIAWAPDVIIFCHHKNKYSLPNDTWLLLGIGYICLFWQNVITSGACRLL